MKHQSPRIGVGIMASRHRKCNFWEENDFNEKCRRTFQAWRLVVALFVHKRVSLMHGPHRPPFPVSKLLAVRSRIVRREHGTDRINITLKEHNSFASVSKIHSSLFSFLENLESLL